MSFKDIKGQDRAINFLKTSYANNKVSHAYIFLGPDGVGKKTIALNFAKLLNCLSETPNKPCDNCASCKKTDSLNHPDIFLLREEKKGASVKIDDIRELIRLISLKPYEGRYKVFIIDGADFLTQEAANALLKTLEEPPRGSILILIVEDISSIFRTIVSRSQIVRFFPLTANEIKDVLVKKYGIDDLKAHILSYISSGSLGSAIKFKDGDFMQKRVEVINELSKDSFFNSDFDGLSKDDFKLYLDTMLIWYRDILAKKAGADDSKLVNIDKVSEISAIAKRVDFDYLDGAIRQIILTNSYLDQNANPKLAMSTLGINIGDICMK